MALDSKASFQQRAAQVFISNEEIEKLEAAGIDTYAKYAFCCNFQPGSQDDTPLFNFIEAALGAKPSGASASNFRRLFFESHAMCLQDLKNRLDRNENTEAKILPLAEKVERVSHLKEKLSGLEITSDLEPSHHLIDKAVQQYEENSIRFLDLTSCTSREQEILSDKSTASLTFDENGRIKVSKKQEVAQCSLTGELKLRSAMQRRALAYELAGVASFKVLERWTNHLFHKLQQEPPPGFRYVSQDQLIRADKALWLKVAEDTRAKVQSVVDGDKSVDVAIERWSMHPEIQYYIMPMPNGQGRSGGQPGDGGDKSNPPPVKKFIDKEQNPDRKGPKGKGKGKKITIPDDCTIKFGDTNKPICMKYNVGACKAKIKAGKRCMYGYHVCWRKGCQKPLPANECTH